MNIKNLLLSITVLLVSAYVYAEDAPVRFDSHIKPIFEKHCLECHEGWFPDAGLRLDTIENILEGGRTGPAVVPGKPDKGLIMMMSVPKGGRSAEMPPGDQDLSQQEIDLIREWIRQGLK